MIQPAYTTGIVRMTAGSAVVRGEGTAWVLGLVNGGLLTFGGRAIPIASVESNTQLTLAYPSPAAFEGIYAIDLGRADAASAIVANRRLADVLDGLVGMSPLGAEIAAAQDGGTVLDLIGALSSSARSVKRENIDDLAVGTSQIEGDAVTFGKMQNVLPGVIGRTVAGAGDPGLLTFADLFSQIAGTSPSITLPGYARIPVNVGGGVQNLILQWGAIVSSNSDFVVPFPIAFPNAVLSMSHVMLNAGTGLAVIVGGIEGLVASSFTIRRRVISNGGAVATTTAAGYYIAIGY